MGDMDGQVTTTLLSGFAYLKDNRLLPVGFDKTTVEPDIAVLGSAVADVNFLGGSDVVEYWIDVGENAGPFTVAVELLYQSIGYRWAQNLAQYQAPEPEHFLDFYGALPNMPVAVAGDVVETDE